MYWNDGRSRKPEAKFANDLFREYNRLMDLNNINYEIVEIEIPKLMCASRLGQLREETRYDEAPEWRAKEDEVARMGGDDLVTPYDISIACFLIDVMKREGEKQAIKVKLSKNVVDILRSEGVL